MDDRSDLWEIESAIFAALIPGYPKAPKVETPLQGPFHPPDILVGVWKGAIKVDGEDRPAGLAIDKAGKILLEIGGQSMIPIPIENPLGHPTFKDGTFLGPFLGTIKTADTARASHVVLLNMKLRGNKLNGSASAVAMDGRFCRPFWIDLEKMPGSQN